MISLNDLLARPYYSLFKTKQDDALLAMFDTKGFSFSDEAKNAYRLIKHQPHIYIAWNHYKAYIGSSYQQGGRWKRSHAYHLGTLAHHLNGTMDQYDHNHAHWVEAWFEGDSQFGVIESYIRLQSTVNIAFIPIDHINSASFPDCPIDLPPCTINWQHITGNVQEIAAQKWIVRHWLREIERIIIHGWNDAQVTLLNIQQ